MEIQFRCPKCGQSNRLPFDAATERLQCPQCQVELRVATGATKGDQLSRCLVCPSCELFVRKDFPQRIGVGIVVLGFAASCVAWFYHMVLWTFAILIGTALLDVALYLIVGDVLECYRCHAQYRGTGQTNRHGAFDLEVHERFRQERARLHPEEGSRAGQ